MSSGPLKNKVFLSLLGAVIFMFFFSFMLVPLYNVFCEVTGLNGKIYGPSDFFKKNNETYERQVNIRFLSTVSGSAPVTFYPSETNLEVLTDKVSKTSYIAINNTNKKLTLTIVPSVSPGLAAENVKKIQCFCFSEQTLGPYESQEWPVRFYVDSELSQNVNNVYLSYTLFENEREEVLAVNHEH
tara:strand:- start:5507 stop:6061 length:555 start_codon:yes stop_codon:yes gene_type:complete